MLLNELVGFQLLIFQCDNKEFVSVIRMCDDTFYCRNHSEKCQVFGFLPRTTDKREKPVRDKLPKYRWVDIQLLYRKQPEVYSVLPSGIQQLKCDANTLPCGQGHPVCYKIAETCVYRLNEVGNLLPCKTGNHMQECTDFQCNGMVKCPGYYCIPFSYVCDKSWDCPHGYDEHSCPTLGVCVSLYHCFNSNVCVHPHNICNGHEDCPFHEDEFLCDLHGFSCPSLCKCLQYSVSCRGANLVLWQNEFAKLPFVAFDVTGCNLTDSKLLQFNLREIVYLFAPGNILFNFCPIFGEMAALRILNASANSIMTLKSNCFSDHSFILAIALNQNQIDQIQSEAFINLQSVKKIDLSDNNIQVLKSHTFYSISCMFTLLLVNNPLTEIFPNIFVYAIPDCAHFDSFQVFTFLD